MKLSTGQESTLGNYRELAVIVFGKESKPVKFLDDKISKSKIGANEEVIAPESQMLQLLLSML